MTNSSIASRRRRSATRKKAIESLIDQATERTGRQGETIVSLGSNVGFQLAGYQRDFARADKPDAPFFGQHSLPIGIAVQRLPSGEGRCPRAGWHLQVSPIDVAQFISPRPGFVPALPGSWPPL